MAPFDIPYTIFYRSAYVSVALSCAIFELFDVEIWVRGHSESLKQVSFESLSTISYSTSIVTIALYCINVKNFHGSLTTVVRAQNDSSKTANITLPIPQGLKKFGIAVVLLFPFPPSFPFPPLPFPSLPSPPLPSP